MVLCCLKAGWDARLKAALHTVAWFDSQERRGGWSGLVWCGVVTLGVGGTGPGARGDLALSSTSQSWLSPGATHTEILSESPWWSSNTDTNTDVQMGNCRD